MYMVVRSGGRLIEGLLSLPGRAMTKVWTGSTSIGEYAAKFKVGASRSSYYQQQDTFKGIAKSYGKENENIAIIVAGDSNSVIDAVFDGTMDIKEAKGRIARSLDDTGYTGGRILEDGTRNNIGHRMSLAGKILDDGQKFTRQSNRVRKFASAGGGITILGVSVLVGGVVADWINSKLGGLLDGVLNPASESTLGSMIVLGVVVIGSVYILKATKDVLGS